MGEQIAVLGAGSWGTALAVLLGKKGYRVRLWARQEERAEEIRKNRENKKYLPGVIVPTQVEVETDLPAVLEGSDLVVLSVPSHGVRELARSIRGIFPPDAVVVNTAKGMEGTTLLRISQVLEEELGHKFRERISVLSGPSHAEEVGANLPTAVVVSAFSPMAAERVQDIFMSPCFRVYTNMDMVGVEISGALKNVIALGTGISDGLGYGDNTKAAMITRGVAEIARLGLVMGAEMQTFAGLAGIGDLVVTCTSMHSRNRRAGIQLGQGEPLEQVLKNMGMVVEGVNATRVARKLARKFGVEMPIVEETYQVLFEGKDTREAVFSLMTRSKTHEGEKELLHL